MNKRFLVDVYFWSPQDRQYKFSFIPYEEGKSLPLPMTFITSRTKGGSTYYLYKVEVNSEVIIDTYDCSQEFSSCVGFVENDGSVTYRYSIARQRATSMILFDDLIDSNGYVLMCSEWYGAYWGHGWCEMHFRSPLLIVV